MDCTVHPIGGDCACGSSMDIALAHRGNKSNPEFKYKNKNYHYTKN
jgi:hypothetical protein